MAIMHLESNPDCPRPGEFQVFKLGWQCGHVRMTHTRRRTTYRLHATYSGPLPAKRQENIAV